jgi:energy-coupling factor transporter ATP-binding protein EcfA2
MAESGIKIYFGGRHLLDKPMPPRSVLIAPERGDWNDFSIRSGVELKITDTGARAFRLPARLGFLGEGPNGTDRLRQLMSSSTELILADESFKYFTMLISIDDYRTAVGHLEVPEAQAFLLSMHDIVATQELKPKTPWLAEAVRSKIFSMSFVRNSEAYFAFRNAGSILHGLKQEDLGRISQSLAITFQLDGVKNEHDLTFEFDPSSILPKRVAVVIGKNGVGKSQTLTRIAKAAIEGSTALRDASTGDRPIISRLLAFAPTNEVASVFPPERRRTQKIWYRRLQLNRMRGGKGPFVNDLIVQVARTTGRIKDVSRWEIFRKAITALNRPEQLCLRLRNASTSSTPLEGLNNANEQTLLERFSQIDARGEPMRLVEGKLRRLSSGELSFIRFAALASLHIENGTLILLDEPETHLHPNFISQFSSLLERILELTGSIAIIATHSTYFVREVFREQVTVLRITPDGYIESLKPRLRTFGGDVGAIAFFVFGEETQSHLGERVKARLLATNRTWEELYAEFKDELSIEFLTVLRRERES